MFEKLGSAYYIQGIGCRGWIPQQRATLTDVSPRSRYKYCYIKANTAEFSERSTLLSFLMRPVLPEVTLIAWTFLCLYSFLVCIGTNIRGAVLATKPLWIYCFVGNMCVPYTYS